MLDAVKSVKNVQITGCRWLSCLICRLSKFPVINVDLNLVDIDLFTVLYYENNGMVEYQKL